MRWAWGITLLLGWLTAPAFAGLFEIFGEAALTDGSRFAFVASKNSPVILAVDSAEQKLAADIPIPEIATAIVVTQELGKLVAIHAGGEVATVVDLDDRQVAARLPLGTKAEVVLSNAYDRFVTFGGSDGTIATWDLLLEREVLRVEGLDDATRLTFSFDGGHLFAVQSRRKTVSVINMTSRSVEKEIPLGGPKDEKAVVSALSRSADGFTGYVSVGSENRLVVVDLSAMTVKASVPVGRAPIRPYSTADNRHVLIPNVEDRSLTVYSSWEERIVATIDLGIAARSVNTGWLDTVAFVSPREGKELAVVDLQRLAMVGTIALPGPTDDGVVTSDSKALLASIADTGEVVIVDARSRKLRASVRPDVGPLQGIAMAITNNVCH